MKAAAAAVCAACVHVCGPLVRRYDRFFGWLFLGIWLWVHITNLVRLHQHVHNPEILDAMLRASHPGRVTIRDSITAELHDTARVVTGHALHEPTADSSSASTIKRAASRALRRDSTEARRLKLTERTVRALM